MFGSFCLFCSAFQTLDAPRGQHLSLAVTIYIMLLALVRAYSHLAFAVPADTIRALDVANKKQAKASKSEQEQAKASNSKQANH